MVLNPNTAVTSGQLHNATSQRIDGGEAKYYADTSNSLGHDKRTAAGFGLFVPTVALNISSKAKVSSRRVPGGNASSMGVL